MASSKSSGVERQVGAILQLGSVRDLTDGQLLERLTTDPGEGGALAFAALVERHGPMVLRVARGILADPNDAEDTFQATFLVLIARARGLWTRDSLGPWLHQVALRTARCQRTGVARRRRLDRGVVIPEATATVPDGSDERAQILHEEINRLPDRFRVPVILCDLEGRTHEQAARALGWPIGTVKSRQARARDRLRTQLTRRGVAPEFSWTLIRPALVLSLPPTLVNRTTAAGVRLLSCRAVVPGTAAALAREVMTTMNWLQLMKMAAVVLALGTASSVGWMARGPGKPADAPADAVPPAQPDAGPTAVTVQPGQLKLTISERGIVEPSRAPSVVCEVEGTTPILWIRPEGTQIKKGELVAQLETATLKDRLADQTITAEHAKRAYDRALIDHESAQLAEREFTQGLFPHERESFLGQIAADQANLSRITARMERLKLARRRLDDAANRRTTPEAAGDILADLTIAAELDAAESDRMAQQLGLETTQAQFDLLMKFTRQRTTRRLADELEKATAAELAQRSTWELEKLRVVKLNRQVESCRLLAPIDGELVYCDDPPVYQIAEGATVRERQLIFKVIAPSDPMQVNAKTPEALVEQVRPGQSVRIRVDSLPDQILTGIVRGVAPMADAVAFRAEDRKVYTTLIQLDPGGPRLRHGVQAAVEITAFNLADVLTVPTGAVVRLDGQDRVAVMAPAGAVELRPVILGRATDVAVEVKQGLQAGDRVILDPTTRARVPAPAGRRPQPPGATVPQSGQSGQPRSAPTPPTPP